MVDELIRVDGIQMGEVLREACQLNLAVELKRQSDPEQETLRAALLDYRADGSICLEAPTRGSVPVMVRPEEQVFVALTLHQQAYQFEGLVTARELATVGGRKDVSAIVLAGPEAIQRIQRRNYFRVKLSGVRKKVAHLWIIEQEPPEGKLKAVPMGQVQMVDLSAGGTRILVPGQYAKHLKLDRDAIIAMPLEDPDKPIRLQSVVRFAKATREGPWQVGLKFLGLEETHEGRLLAQQLEHHVAALEREEIQRHRGQA